MGKPVIERFWSKVLIVKDEDSCWLWQASKFPCGYGRFGYNGSVTNAHIVAYILSKGPVTPGKDVLHTCDVYGCVRPSHLYEGDAEQNAADAIARGRFVSNFRRGDDNYARTHPDAFGRSKADELRALRESTGLSHRALGAVVGLSPSSVGRILNGKAWS